MRYEYVFLTIPGTTTGVYIAYPTIKEFKPTYRGHKTLVNHDHTKVGITRSNFIAREDEYMSTFQFEVAFFPVLELSADHLARFEARLLAELSAKYPRSGTAKEWFSTTKRQAIAELVWRLSDCA